MKKPVHSLLITDEPRIYRVTPELLLVGELIHHCKGVRGRATYSILTAMKRCIFSTDMNFKLQHWKNFINLAAWERLMRILWGEFKAKYWWQIDVFQHYEVPIGEPTKKRKRDTNVGDFKLMTWLNESPELDSLAIELDRAFVNCRVLQLDIWIAVLIHNLRRVVLVEIDLILKIKKVIKQLVSQYWMR